jgi:hypothetical protein
MQYQPKLHMPNLSEHSPFAKYLLVDPSANQLHSFIALVHGIKPSMDMWIRPEGWSAFEKLVNYFGLVYHLNAYFDSTDNNLSSIPQHLIATTRASFAKAYVGNVEAHVFVAASRNQLQEVVSRGWYPLLIDGYYIQKHLADYVPFGKALGYPSCCCDFFQKHNNWYCENTYYRSFQNTTFGKHNILSNGLLRHTAFSYIPHMPCSFNCESSKIYARQLRDIICAESLVYAEQIDLQLSSPTLCLSEQKIFRFDGELKSLTEIFYKHCQLVTPTRVNEPLYYLLAEGDQCVIEVNVLRVFKRGKPIGSYLATGNKKGPEAPFFVACT